MFRLYLEIYVWWFPEDCTKFIGASFYVDQNYLYSYYDTLEQYRKTEHLIGAQGHQAEAISIGQYFGEKG